MWIDPVGEGDKPAQWALNAVHFSPGARTAWHRHSAGQTLYVTEGEGLVQPRGGDIATIRPGDVIRAAAEEWHWHGAAPDSPMTHVTVQMAGPDSIDWDVDEGDWANGGA